MDLIPNTSTGMQQAAAASSLGVSRGFGTSIIEALFSTRFENVTLVAIISQQQINLLLIEFHQYHLRVLHNRIHPAFVSVSCVFWENSRVKMSLKSWLNFKIISNILAKSKD